MAHKTIVVSCLVAGLALAGCSRAPQPDADEPPAAAETVTETAPQAPAVPEIQARAGLMRIEDEAWRVPHEATGQFYDGDLAALHERFSEELKQSVTLEMLTKKRQDVRDKYGEETEVIGEELQEKDGYRGFMRWARFDKFDGVIEVLWILREDDSIAGFFVRPTEPSKS